MSSLNRFSPIQTTTPLIETPDTETTLNEKQVLLKFVLIGDAKTGKTSLVNKFLDNKLNENYHPTTTSTLYDTKSSTSTQQIIIEDEKTDRKYIIQLQLWDTKGKLPENMNIPIHIPQLLKSEKPHSLKQRSSTSSSCTSPTSPTPCTENTNILNVNQHIAKNNEFPQHQPISFRRQQHQNKIRQPLLLSKYNNLHSTPIANIHSYDHELDLVSFFDEVDAKEAMEDMNDMDTTSKVAIFDISEKPPIHRKKKNGKNKRNTANISKQTVNTEAFPKSIDPTNHSHDTAIIEHTQHNGNKVIYSDDILSDKICGELKEDEIKPTKHMDLKQMLNSHLSHTTNSTLDAMQEIEHKTGYSSESLNGNTKPYTTSSDDDDGNLTSLMFESLDALILVYDITNHSSFSNLNGWISLFTEYNIDGEDIPILLLGNKKDLEHQRVIQHKQGRKFCHLLKNPHKLFHEVSAKFDTNDLKDIFTELARKCINREASVLQLMSADSIQSIQSGTTYKRAVRSKNFSVKTCTNHICGNTSHHTQPIEDPFCVVL